MALTIRLGWENIFEGTRHAPFPDASSVANGRQSKCVAPSTWPLHEDRTSRLSLCAALSYDEREGNAPIFSGCGHLQRFSVRSISVLRTITYFLPGFGAGSRELAFVGRVTFWIYKGTNVLEIFQCTYSRYRWSFGFKFLRIRIKDVKKIFFDTKVAASSVTSNLLFLIVRR